MNGFKQFELFFHHSPCIFHVSGSRRSPLHGAPRHATRSRCATSQLSEYCVARRVPPLGASRRFPGGSRNSSSFWTALRLEQFAPRHTFDRMKPAHGFAWEKRFRISASKGPDQAPFIMNNVFRQAEWLPENLKGCALRRALAAQS